MQARVERLHRLLNDGGDAASRWIKERGAAAEGLAHIEPALVLTPPAGLEIGHVPVPIYEGVAQPTDCDEVIDNLPPPAAPSAVPPEAPPASSSPPASPSAPPLAPFRSPACPVDLDLSAPCAAGERCAMSTYCCPELCHGEQFCFDSLFAQCSYVLPGVWQVVHADPACAFVPLEGWCHAPPPSVAPSPPVDATCILTDEQLALQCVCQYTYHGTGGGASGPTGTLLHCE